MQLMINIEKMRELSDRKAEVLALVSRAGKAGLTWHETSALLEAEHGKAAHHGTSSGTLSLLHKSGHVVMLAEKRGKSHVYVVPTEVHDRDTRPRRTNRGDIALLDELRRVTAERDAALAALAAHGLAA